MIQFAKLIIGTSYYTDLFTAESYIKNDLNYLLTITNFDPKPEMGYTFLTIHFLI